MNIIIKSLGFRAGNNLKAFVNEKVEKLFKQCDEIIRANVILSKGGSKDAGSSNLCEIRLVVPGNDHFVKKSSEGYHRSVSLSVDALQEMRRNKTKPFINK